MGNVSIQQTVVIFLLSLMITLFAASALLNKFKFFDGKNRTSSDRSPSAIIGKIGMTVTGIVGLTCLMALILSIIENK